MKSEAPPVAIIGGGPVGLVAASHALSRGRPVKLYEAGATVGANLLEPRAGLHAVGAAVAAA